MILIIPRDNVRELDQAGCVSIIMFKTGKNVKSFNGLWCTLNG